MKSITYKQDVKEKSRMSLWKHSINALTRKRNESRIIKSSYIYSLWEYIWKEVLSQDSKTFEKLTNEYIKPWEDFSNSCYKSTNAKDLKIAYFSGPEPENDLETLLNLGVRIENIWAFEMDKDIYKEALKKARTRYRELKIFPGSIKDFVKTNHFKFDIIYLDFTGSLVQKKNNTIYTLHAIFEQQALNDLSVLIVNSCEPDNKDDVLNFLGKYFFFQPFVEQSIYKKNPKSIFVESAVAYGYSSPDELARKFSENIHNVYSAFATHYPIYYANILNPSHRFLSNAVLRKQIFSSDKNHLNDIFKRVSSIDSLEEMMNSDNESSHDSLGGIRYLNHEEYPFWNFIDSLKGASELEKYWHDQFTKNHNTTYEDSAKFIEMLPTSVFGAEILLSEKIKEMLININDNLLDKNGGLFCDVPLPYLWLELALYQLGAPYHSNIDKHKRWAYQAKERVMHIDAFTFDRCRNLYDYLPMPDMYDTKFRDYPYQMLIRSCIDAIHKQMRYPLHNLYYGSNIACINSGVPGAKFGELNKRIHIK
ncbi:hypothetical protein [Mannheimia varigena]|uniref:hypothetical protein n=1 Tax=Mannheimia varigena TaxID=85404 RepID=UPI0003E3F707|nr:hypothetical protein [Mannheimia varigena]AHG77331.1 hypothetical protein X874_6950 [Mannheimia varigena USDA-ARS-USMARC-1312]